MRFRRKNKAQKPSLLSDLLIGDIDVKGHIEIVVPRATDRMIVIDISTREISDLDSSHEKLKEAVDRIVDRGFEPKVNGTKKDHWEYYGNPDPRRGYMRPKRIRRDSNPNLVPVIE